MSLDPPGHGLLLHMESYGGETKLLPNVLTAVIVTLAAAVLWNVWALRRHVRRRLATEEALRAEHAFRKAMEDSLHTGMRAVDLEGRIVYVNPAFCSMVGYSEAELIGSLPRSRTGPRGARAHRRGRPGRTRARRGARGHRAEAHAPRRERFDALIYEAPLIDAQGRQSGWMGSVLDITERKRAPRSSRGSSRRSCSRRRASSRSARWPRPSRTS